MNKQTNKLRIYKANISVLVGDVIELQRRTGNKAVLVPEITLTSVLCIGN